MKLGRKALLVALAALLALAISPAAWVAAQESQVSQVVDITLSPSGVTANVGDTFTLDVLLLPNGQPVASADALINFDPTYLEVTQVATAPGSPFDFELSKSFDNVAGHVDYGAGTFSPPPSAGEITFALISFRAKAPTLSTAVTFSLVSDRLTNAGFEGQSVLRNATGATVAISGTQPSAAFAADVTSGAAPLTVRFTDTSTGNPTAWLWYFGDGSTSSQQNPIHVYSSVGVYTVTLIITVPGAQPSLTRNGYITVLAPTPTPLPLPTTTATPLPTATSIYPTLTPAPTSVGATPTQSTPTPTRFAGATATPGPIGPSPVPPGLTPTGTPAPAQPPTGGNDFGGLLPWLAGAGLITVFAGALLRKKQRVTQ